MNNETTNWEVYSSNHWILDETTIQAWNTRVISIKLAATSALATFGCTISSSRKYRSFITNPSSHSVSKATRRCIRSRFDGAARNKKCARCSRVVVPVCERNILGAWCNIVFIGDETSVSFLFLIVAAMYATCCTHTSVFNHIAQHSPARSITINLFIAFYVDFPSKQPKFIHSACWCTIRANLISCDRERERYLGDFPGNSSLVFTNFKNCFLTRVGKFMLTNQTGNVLVSLGAKKLRATSS